MNHEELLRTQIHPSAEIAADAQIGPGCRIWNHVQIRTGASIGAECVIGRDVYIDAGVHIGRRCKIQNGVAVYAGVTIGNGVFLGPHVCFTNDLRPRAVTPAFELKSADDWTITATFVHDGASIGANSTIRCGVSIGAWAMVGAGCVVTKDVPPHALVIGNPARLRGYVCRCGRSLRIDAHAQIGRCDHCGAAGVVQLG